MLLSSCKIALPQDLFQKLIGDPAQCRLQKNFFIIAVIDQLGIVNICYRLDKSAPHYLLFGKIIRPERVLDIRSPPFKPYPNQVVKILIRNAFDIKIHRIPRERESGLPKDVHLLFSDSKSCKGSVVFAWFINITLSLLA